MGGEFGSVASSQFKPVGCFIDGAYVQPPACKVYDSLRLLRRLRDPDRRLDEILRIARDKSIQGVLITFGADKSLNSKVKLTVKLQDAVAAAYANVFANIQTALIQPAAAAPERVVYAVADSARVVEIQSRVMEESARSQAQALDNLWSQPERRSVDLYRVGRAHRQLISIGKSLGSFD